MQTGKMVQRHSLLSLFWLEGGELVTAALVNGVPHPPGYPLYILLLQGWLRLAQALGLDPEALRSPEGLAMLTGGAMPEGASPLAMACA